MKLIFTSPSLSFYTSRRLWSIFWCQNNYKRGWTEGKARQGPNSIDFFLIFKAFKHNLIVKERKRYIFSFFLLLLRVFTSTLQVSVKLTKDIQFTVRFQWEKKKTEKKIGNVFPECRREREWYEFKWISYSSVLRFYDQVKRCFGIEMFTKISRSWFKIRKDIIWILCMHWGEIFFFVWGLLSVHLKGGIWGIKREKRRFWHVSKCAF